MDEKLIALIRKASRRIRPVPSGIRTRGALPRRPAAVLFDVYGTLLQRLEKEPADSEAQVGRLIRRYRLGLRPQELHAALAEAIEREHVRLRESGISHPEVKIERMWRTVFPSHTAEDLRHAIVEYEVAVHPCWPMPGSRRLIHTLAKQGYILGIVSNAQFYTPLHFAALLGGRPEALGFMPDLCFYSWERGKAKPSRDMLHRAAAVLRGHGIAREEVLMVGNDPVNDIAAGAKAGFMTVQVAADRRAVPTRSRQGDVHLPDGIVGRLADLATLLKKDRPGRRGT